MFGFGVNEVEEARFTNDKKMYGNYQNGIYNGISWEMKRSFMGNWFRCI
jgi:hypothetical protein